MIKLGQKGKGKGQKYKGKSKKGFCSKRVSIQKGKKHEDIKGFCKSATLAEIQKHNFVLTLGRYVGIKDEVDDGVPFEEKNETVDRRNCRTDVRSGAKNGE